ncbi:MAG: O-antigen translocase [Bacteroidia bacterium]|nr:O-antigen translocase [Bacteroidia bacterium]
MQESQSSYKQIIKATSLFGGVQVVNIVISIIRSKIIAVLLGPAGMGIAGLLSSTTGFISGLTNFGIGTSAVKSVAEANATANNLRIATIVAVLRRWVWITGLLGTIVTIALSPWLSQLTFGNRDYTFAFIYISVTLLFNQLSSGQLVVLQGMRKLQYLAKANLLGSLLGLLFSIPLYYIWGVKAIVPAIVISSIVALLLSWFFSNKIEIETVKVTKAVTIAEGKKMLIMGFMISLSGLITLGTSYLVRIYISNTGGIEQVGLYNAGFAIIATYVGMVFSAMGTDYYPRLAAVAHSNVLCKQTINEQAEIAILILAPIVLLFLVFIQWVVIILYSNKFVAINEMVHWAILGMLFKAASWSMGYVLFAKGDSKTLLWNEILSNSYLLGLNILGYYLFGLTGLGISFMFGFILHLFQIFIVIKIKFQFSFTKEFMRIFLIHILLAVSCFLIVKLIDKPYSYYLGSILLFISTWFSYKELDKRIGLNTILIKLKNRVIKK